MPGRALIILAAGLLLAGLQAEELPPSEPAKRQTIRELLEVTGQWQTSQAELNKLIDAYQRRLPRVKAATWLQLRQSLTADGLEEAIIDVYDRLLSVQEVEKALAFYKSDAGRKLAQLTPQLREETAAALQEWRQKMAAEIHRRLNATVEDQ